MQKTNFTKTTSRFRRSILLGVLTFCFVMLDSVLFAAHAQEMRLSIRFNKESVSSSIQKIAKETNIDFFFSQEQMDRLDKKVEGTYSSESLQEILTDIFEDTAFTFTFEDNGVVIMPRPVKETTLQAPKSVEIKGTVFSSDNQPLSGATVIVVGTYEGAITDAKGEFTLTTSPNNRQLEVSYVGYKTVIYDITDNTKPQVIKLDLAAIEIEDIVVTGVFTRKSNTYSGAVTTIKAEELERSGSINLIAALGTIDPSFTIVTNNDMGSDPNSMPDIQMRGAGSFSDMSDMYTTSPNQPLFILDGFETSLSKVLDMDMNRVESINLLKDATAKAIYGSKGANGVVVITTKTPEIGKLKVSYKGDLNIQAPVLSSYDRTNAAEKLEIERLAGVYTSSSNHPYAQDVYDQRYNAIMQEVLAGVDTDWLAIPTRVGVGQKHSLILEGGDEIFRYDVNVAYNNVAGVMKGSERNTFEGGINFQYRYKNLLFKNQLSYVNTKSANSPYGDFSDYAKMNPYWRAYDSEGNVNQVLGSYSALQAYDVMTIYNPMINAYSNYKNETVYDDLTNNFYVEWAMNKEFKLTGRLGVTKYSSQTDVFYPSNYTTLNASSSLNYITVTPDDDNYFDRGLYQLTISDRMSFSSDVILSYTKSLGKHLVYANGQYSISTSNSTSTSFEGTGFADNATEITQARSYKDTSSPYGSDNKVRELGALLSVNYSYDSRYLFDANYRANASSLFGTNNRWGHFYSVGGGWNLHNEKFMEEVNLVNLLKARVSYGYSGKQNFSAYQAMATYQYFTDEIYGYMSGAYLLAMYNPDLKWELTADTNFGIDLAMFDSRLNLTLDYYVKNTENLLTPVTAVESIGFSTYIENLGKSQNKGVEAKVNYRVIRDSKRDTYFSVFGSLAHNVNKLVEINEALSSINDSTTDEFTGNGQLGSTYSGVSTPRVLYQEGVSLNAIWAVKSLGIDPSNGKEMFVKKDGTTTYTWSSDDLQPLGDTQPKLQGTFGFNFDMKGFSVNANFAYSVGGQYYNQTLADNVEAADVNYNVDRRVFTDRWSSENAGVATKYSALSQYPYYTKPTSRFIQDLNELRLSSLNVGYDFRNCNFIKKSEAIERLKLSFAANELFYLSTVKAERGILYPYAQSFIFTVQATF